MLISIISLGLVLLEIAYWEPIRAFSMSNDSPEKFTQRLLNRPVADLPYRMGSKYHSAVLNCLQGPSTDDLDRYIDGEMGEQTNAQLKWFYWEVVDKLRQCQA
jgi:hypothetical protein